MKNQLLKATNVLMILLQGALGFVGFVITAMLLGVTIDWFQPFSTICLTLLFGFLALCVHEGGHWLGARMGGMTVIQAKVFAMELQPLRCGFRARWSRRSKGQSFSGYVMAADAPNQPMRRARLLMIVMGPLANLLVGGMFAVIALAAWPTLNIALAFATINLATGLANLVPTARTLYSDGALLISWWLRPDENKPEFAHARLIALSVSGVAAEDLPLADQLHLTQQPMPMPLVALSFRMDASMAAGDWESTLQLGKEMDALIKASPDALKSGTAVVAILRRELELCRAIHQANADSLKVAVLNDDIDWYAPALAPSCRAVQAALRGDRDTAERELAQADQFAMNSQIQSYAALQRALAGHIRGLLPVIPQ